MADYNIDLSNVGLVTENDLLNKILDTDPDKAEQDWIDRQPGPKDDDGEPLNPDGSVRDITPPELKDQQLKNAVSQLGKIDKALSPHRVDTTSIVGRAKRSVLQFPIYMTQSVRVNESHTIGKLFERVYATLVQSVLSQNPIIDEEDVNNLRFLKQFHTNLKEAADNLVNRFYQPIDELDRMMQESIFYSHQISENVFVEFRVIPCIDQDLILENARLMNEPLTGFQYLREADERIKKTTSRERTLGGKDEVKIDEAYLQRIVDAENKKLTDAGKPATKTIDDLKIAIRNSPTGFTLGSDKVYVRTKGGNEEFYIPSTRKDDKITTTTSIEPGDVRDPVDAPKFTKDSDIKKFNGMLPYTIEATFRIRPRQGGLERDIKFVIGIKSVMHLISPSDLSSELRELIMGNMKSLQKIRHKTGEIDLKDYLFNTRALKADAAKHINYSKRWINTHKRLGEYDKMHGSLLQKPIKAITGGAVPIPNGTLVLAQPDVTKLTNETGIDLSLVSNAKRLARALFLIGIVIVDSTAGTMRVLFPDNDTDWDVQSLAAIDAEVAKTDNSGLMREINRSINR